MSPQRPGAGSSGRSPQAAAVGAEPGFIERIIMFLAGGGDPQREKARLLRLLGKALKKQRFKFYRPRGKQALPAIAKFFFDVYRAVGSARQLLANAQQSAALKTVVVESYLTDSQKAARNSLEEPAIRERAKQLPPKELAAELKETMVRFFGEFDSKTVKRINDLYSVIQSFLAFINFDYYFFLKKFDSSLPENNLVAIPRFEPISADYISDDIKDFLEVALALGGDANWDEVLDVLKTLRNVDVVARTAWKKVVSVLDDVKRSGILVQIVQHIDDDPFYKPSISVQAEHIVEPYLEKVRTQAETTVKKILLERKNEKIDQLVTIVFGTTAVSWAKNYSDKTNLLYTKRGVEGFTFTSPFNFLKAFLLDYFKKDVRDLHDLLIVRGRWSTSIMSQQFSEAYHQVMSVAEQTVTFDDSLADEGELGMKLRKASGRVVDRDPGTTKLLRNQLIEINEMAQDMLNESSQNLIVIGQRLKAVIEDFDKPKHELIINWKEVEASADYPIRPKMIEAYKKIYYFVQLMQMYVRRPSA